MIKHLELSSPDSCLNKAADDEPVFVLRAKDSVAIAAVLAWANLRVVKGLNAAGDEKMRETYKWVDEAIAWRDKNIANDTNR